MNKKIPVSKNLKKLATIFNKPLYIVGGYVRDSLLDYKPTDIDLASTLTPDEVMQILENTEYKVKETSPKLMTLKIIVDDEAYEYTTFRKETYQKGHSPDTVIPTMDIVEDAKRRDFRMNAIYYNINADEIIDPLDGIADIKDRVINTVDSPQKVFSQDGLRLMRLARMAAQLGFIVSIKTMEGARENAMLIDDIAPERIRDELDLILVADTVHNIEYSHKKGLMILDLIYVLERILPELTLGKGMVQRADFHKYDVFFHIINTVKYADSKVRLAALMHDIGKPKCYKDNGRYFKHEEVGARMTKEILGRLRYPNKTINYVAQLVLYHMYDLRCDAKLSTLKLFVQEHRDILEDLFLLKQADSLGGGIFSNENPSIIRIRDVYHKMIEDKIPFTIKDLYIDGKAVEEFPPKMRGDVLLELLRECAINENLLTEEAQRKFIQKQLQKYKKKV
ncbi:MAG: CCA tRNA nucleotidyltransferase [Clostridia bacterium]